MIIIFLITWIICGLVSAGVWQSKGGSYAAGFWLGALLGFLGLFYVAFAQPEGASHSGIGAYSTRGELVRPRPAAMKTCPRCAEEIKAAAVVCRFCAYEFPAAEHVQEELARAEVFEGSEVTDLREHAFGVTWGRTPNNDVVYKEPSDEAWRIYEKGKTALVPPAGYVNA